MNPLIQGKNTTRRWLTTLALLYFGLLPMVRAVNPAPDGCYPSFTTAEGCDALRLLATGAANTGLGWRSLFSNSSGNFNTGVGAGALVLNNGNSNTAVGAAALLLNTVGHDNTANGVSALASDTEGFENTGNGSSALGSNVIGNSNTADGYQALFSNATGTGNTASGVSALFFSNGSDNTALGINAGLSVITANNVICIGANVYGADVSDTCFIGNIFGSTSFGGIPALVNSNGQLGTVTSSRRFKQDIKPMEQASEALLRLKPVTFRYKKEIDRAGVQQFGLVAEDVEKVNPELVVRDKEGKPYSVRYDQVNAMLLNEFLKEHAKVDQLKKDFESKIAEQQKQIEALTAGLQKVSAQLAAESPSLADLN